jgi:hypothetical protein
MEYEIVPMDLRDLEVDPPAPQYLRAIIIGAVTVLTLVSLFFYLFPITTLTGAPRDLGFVTRSNYSGSLDPIASSTLGHDILWTETTPTDSPQTTLTGVMYFRSFRSTTNVCVAEIIQGALPEEIIPSGNDLLNTRAFISSSDPAMTQAHLDAFKTGFFLSLAPAASGRRVASIVVENADAIALVRAFGVNRTVVEASVSCTNSSPEAQALRSDALLHLVITATRP